MSNLGQMYSIICLVVKVVFHLLDEGNSITYMILTLCFSLLIGLLYTISLVMVVQ